LVSGGHVVRNAPYCLIKDYNAGFALLTFAMGHATSRGLRSFRYSLALVRCHMRNKKPVVVFHPFLRCVFNFFLWAALGHFGLYTLGILWLQAALKMTFENALKQGLVCFLVGDVLKTAIAALITPALWMAAVKIAQRFTFIKPEEAKELVSEP
jgi:biotin transporter BioY